jgi:hypothetical protein
MFFFQTLYQYLVHSIDTIRHTSNVDCLAQYEHQIWKRNMAGYKRKRARGGNYNNFIIDTRVVVLRKRE